MNCIIIDDDELSSNALKQLILRVDYLHLVKVINRPLEALDTLQKEKIDLIFLDIEMPEMSGMELIESLDNRPLTILTTSHKEYALKAFDMNVVDYLIKPLEFPRFLKAVNKARSMFNQPEQPEGGLVNSNYLYIRKNSVLNKIQFQEILWIEALGDYVTIHTPDQKFTQHITLKALENKLPKDKFSRVHRSYIVHLDHISSIDDYILSVHGKSIPVGLIYRDSFIKKLNLLL